MDEGILEKAALKFDLPGEVVANMPKVEITGGRRLVLENHRGILTYSEDEIRVAGNRVTVRIRGKELELRAMSSEGLLITGIILGVDFEL